MENKPRRHLALDWRVTSALATITGMAIWQPTMASAPRYSQGPDLDMGNVGALLVGLMVGAAVVGLVTPRRAWVAGAMIGVGALVLAPGTAPRGDGDGLWFYIVPTLLFVSVVCLGLAAFSSYMRTEWHRWRSERSEQTDR